MESTALVPFLISSIFLLIVAVLVTRYAVRKGFFHRLALSPCPTTPISWYQLAAAFGLYFVITLLYSPIAYLFLRHQDQATWATWGGWLHLSYLLILLGSILLYLRHYPALLRLFFLQHPWKQAFRSLGLGALSWLLAAPWIFLIYQMTQYITQLLWPRSSPDQVAVQHLKEVWHQPALYLTTLFFMCFLVPVLEEILFRGFLQTFLRTWCTRWGSVILTASIFTCVHFGIGQDVSNFTILSSLFPLSVLLGYLYEREQSLWAPIGLHIVFNCLSGIFVTIKLW